MEIQNKKSRIEWVDTAKGICILFEGVISTVSNALTIKV